MTSEELDELILATASPHWQKVAMIIAKVSQNERFASANVDTQLDLIADRIGNLVANGQLSAQGDISNWRHSEIRLKA